VTMCGTEVSHTGCTNVLSTTGQGTTFQVLLSCASDRAPETRRVITSAGKVRYDAPAEAIPAVGDEEVLRLAVSKGLTKRGFSVIEACDGSEVMELIRRRADWHRPGSVGCHLTGHFKPRNLQRGLAHSTRPEDDSDQRLC